MKYHLPALVLGACLFASCTQAPVPIQQDTQLPIQTSSGTTASTSSGQRIGVVTEEVTYYELDGVKVKGFVAKPVGEGTYPALVLIHEWWGMNDNMRDLARQFAAQGYLAMTVDLYNGKSATTQQEAQTLATAVRENTAGAMNNLGAAVTYLKTRNDVIPDRLASVGWCFGGGWAYEMAKNDAGVKATVMYYGRFAPEDDLSMMKSHIIGHFGEKDMSIKVSDVQQFQATLRQNSAEHEIYIYPNAGHGFANESNAGYDPAAAQDAMDRTLDFLKRQL